MCDLLTPFATFAASPLTPLHCAKSDRLTSNETSTILYAHRLVNLLATASRVVVAFLETVMGGADAWAGDETIRRAIEIRDGVLRNPKIARFQHRAVDFPHAVAD